MDMYSTNYNDVEWTIYLQTWHTNDTMNLTDRHLLPTLRGVEIPPMHGYSCWPMLKKYQIIRSFN
jgi:hypothetical protein